MEGEERLIRRELSLEVSLPRSEYIVGEPIYLLVRLKNNSDVRLPVVPLKVSSSDIAGNLGVVMSREDGVREYHPPYLGSERVSTSPALEHLPLLEPGKDWFIVVELLSYFCEGKGLLSQPGSRVRIGRGTYQLQAFYRWDFRPSVVVRSEMLTVTIAKPPARERWRARRLHWRARGLRGRYGASGEEPVRLCRGIYSLGRSALLTGDWIRAAIKAGLEEDPLASVGALHVIEENEEGPPLFLYDLITYREAVSPQEEEDYHAFLDEILARWPDGFLGEVARQKRHFETIALAGTASGARPKSGDG
jgi:hypothetical protein